MADIRTMMDEYPSPRSAGETRHAFAVALVKPGRCSSRYQSKNSFRPMLYTLFVMGDLTESSTRPFIRRHSFALSTTVNSFILNPLMGNIGSHEDITSGPRGQGFNRLISQVRAKSQSRFTVATETPATSAVQVAGGGLFTTFAGREATKQH